MDQANISVKYFIISGISDVPMLHVIIFFLVLLIYLLTLSGNLTILLLVCLDPQLHTPMYFFLCNLSILDISCSTNNLNNVLISFLSGDNTISVLRCIIQIFIFISLTCAFTSDELLILTAMSYDRYVAICNPLRYSDIMSKKVCSLLACACWVMGFISTIPSLLEISSFTCYTSLEVNHFFCDIMPVMKLTCNDTTVLELYAFIVGLLFATFTPFVLTFISYTFIIHAILRIRSSIGRRKAFYTCSSHLTVVNLLYGTLILYITLCYQYFRPISSVSLDSNKLYSLFNTVAVPILNPLIYSLKNKDVILAMKRRLRCFTTRVKEEKMIKWI
ncbi:odorant binding, partial [Pristimantis euphronides]